MPQCCSEIKVMLKLLQTESKTAALAQSVCRISASPCGFPSEEDVGLITFLDLVERGLDFYLNPWRPSVPRTLRILAVLQRELVSFFWFFLSCKFLYYPIVVPSAVKLHAQVS